MCRTVKGSGSTGYVLYTCDKPHSVKKPAFIARDTVGSQSVSFTENLWGARIWSDRNSMDHELEFLRKKTKKNLLTHQVTVQLSVPE